MYPDQVGDRLRRVTVFRDFSFVRGDQHRLPVLDL